MPDTCRAKSVTINDTTNKTLLHTGPVFLKQLVCFNSSTTEGVEATVTLYDSLDSTPAAGDARFTTCVPRQINSGILNAIIDGIIGSDQDATDGDPYDFPALSVNGLIKVLNNTIIVKCPDQTGSGTCTHGAPKGPPTAAANINGILKYLGDNLKVETPGDPSTWWTLGIGGITLIDLTGTITGFGYLSHQGFITHDDDSEMSYDRNASKVYNFPEPGIFFPHGIAVGALKTDNLSQGTGDKTYVTCVYQEAASNHTGGVVRSVYSAGKKSPASGAEILHNGQCIVDSLHIFNDDDDEMGVKILDGAEELALFVAGDNSLTQIYIPEPGLIIKNQLKIEQTAFGNEAPTSVVFREIN